MRLTALILALMMLAMPAGAQQVLYWTSSPAMAQAMDGAAQRWNQRYPQRAIELTVDLQRPDILDLQLWTTLHSGVWVPGFDQPDLADIEMMDFEKYVNPLNCLLYPLGQSDAPQGQQAAFVLRGLTFGVPCGQDALICVYRRDVLEQLSMRASDIATWSDFKEAGQRLLSLGDVPLLAVDMDHCMAFAGMMAQRLSRGEAEGDAYQNTLDQLARMMQDGVATMMPGGRADSRSFAQAFSAGQVGCCLVRSAQLDELLDVWAMDRADVAVAPMPRVSPDDLAVCLPGYATGVNASSPHAELLREFLLFARPRQDWGAAGEYRPRLDAVNRYAPKYKLDLARMVLE